MSGSIKPLAPARKTGSKAKGRLMIKARRQPVPARDSEAPN